MATTLANLRTKARMFIDESTAVTFSNSDLDIYINDSQNGFWVEMAEYDPSFAMREATATLIANQTEYPYPTDILGRNVRGLYTYAASTPTWIKVPKMGYEQVIELGRTAKDYPVGYCCMDGFFKVGPPPNSSGYSLRIVYKRQPTAMAADDAEMDADDVFAEIIAVGAAIRAIERTGASTENLVTRYAELMHNAINAVIPNDLMQATPAWRYMYPYRR